MNHLPHVEKIVEEIRKEPNKIKRLNMLFKKLPGLCRFKAEELSEEVFVSWDSSFFGREKPSIKDILKNNNVRKLNRK
jgi:hypothetical protein